MPCIPATGKRESREWHQICKNNFIAGRTFRDFDDLSKQLEQWLVNANNRLHGTTKEKPIELFNNKELCCLGKLPALEFESESWHYRRVAKDCHISLENNYYSVPSKYVGKEVGVSLCNELVRVYYQNEIVATHPRTKGVGVFTTNTSHYDKYKKMHPGNAEHDAKYEASMNQIGDSCKSMLSVIKREQKSQWHRAVKGIVNLRKYYSDESINKACNRALHFGISSYSKIKSILDNNCYELPLNENKDGGCNAEYNQ